MASYPINLNLKDRLCIVIGGGRVAWRKVNTLLDTGAKLRIVSPHVIEELTELIRLNQIEYYQKFYTENGGNVFDAIENTLKTMSKIDDSISEQFDVVKISLE